MSEPSLPPSERARQRAAGKARRLERLRRRETYFDLLVSGYSVEQIAQATRTSASTVRRAVGQALAARRLDAPEDFARLQIARLNKALLCADVSLEEGKLAAVAPYLAVVAEISRFYGFAAAGPLRLTAPAPRTAREPAPRLALAHAAPPLEAAPCDDPKSRTKEHPSP